jgi:hypothetical protein
VENDKLFAAYALVLVAGIGSVIAALLAVGVASPPDPLGLIEHVTFSLLMRASYKSLDGWDWSEWTLKAAHPRARAAAASRRPSIGGGAAGAEA